jgi:hypothetical protein
VLEGCLDRTATLAKLGLRQFRAALVLRDQRTVIQLLFHERKSHSSPLRTKYAVQRVVTIHYPWTFVQ